jgi:hypothetical protein
MHVQRVFSDGRMGSPTQTQPFRLTCHMYLLCTVNMAGLPKTHSTIMVSSPDKAIKKLLAISPAVGTSWARGAPAHYAPH